MKLVNAVTQMLEDEKAGLVWPLPDLLVSIGLASSKGDARRLISQGGIYLHNGKEFEKIEDPTSIFHSGEYIFRRGKHQFKKVILERGGVSY